MNTILPFILFCMSMADWWPEARLFDPDVRIRTCTEIVNHSQTFRMDPLLPLSVAYRESRISDQTHHPTSGARGPFGTMPFWGCRMYRSDGQCDYTYTGMLILRQYIDRSHEMSASPLQRFNSMEIGENYCLVGVDNLLTHRAFTKYACYSCSDFPSRFSNRAFMHYENFQELYTTWLNKPATQQALYLATNLLVIKKI